MFHHILLATDLSDVAEEAFGLATALARAHAARLTLLHVYVVSAATCPTGFEVEAERTWPGVLRARERLDRLVTGLRATGLQAQAVVRFGEAAQRIAEVAGELGVDLVVTGTHGRRGLARLWYGSIAAEVLRRCCAPVLAVPGRTNVIGLRSYRARRRGVEPAGPGARTSS